MAKGLPGRLPPRAFQYAAAADDHNAYRDRCFALTAKQMTAGRYCRIGAADGRRPTLIVWGDSHADAMMSALDSGAQAHAIAGIDATHGSCPPLLGIEVHEHEDNLCPPLNAAALALIERYDIPKVVIAGRWAGYAEGRLYYAPSPPVILRRAGTPPSRTTSTAGDHTLFTSGLEATFARLRGEGREVYVVLPVPETHRPIPSMLARAATLRQVVDVATTRAAYDERQRFVRSTVDRLARKYGVVEIDPAARLCPAAQCQVILDGHPLYYDGDHLSLHGAAFIAPLMAPVFTHTLVGGGQIAQAARLQTHPGQAHALRR